ncbi:MAG: MBL fold metallo-hydrolase [Chloroflexota bacterium]
MNEKQEPDESITFLGTGGARIMVSRQTLASGGMWLKLNGTEILLDPGPGSIIQSTKRNLQPENLSAIIISHRHLDHSGDVNIMVEAMTGGGFKPHGWFFAPKDALDFEPVLYSYLKESLDGIVLLEEGKSYTAGNISFSTPLRHIHGVETYGIIFRTPAHTFSYITDSRYFAGLSRCYTGELLIINTVFLEANPRFYHLSVADAGEIIRHLKPRAAILTHFGTQVWRANPALIAERMSQETGVRVIAASDGMKFDLSELDK